MVEEIIDHGYVVRGWMGAEYVEVSPDLDAPSPTYRGARISALKPDGPAARAGLIPGDVILQFGDSAISDDGDLRNHEAETKPNTTVRVTGVRSGMPFQVSITLMERPTGRPKGNQQS